MNRLTVIIPAFNEAAGIKDTITSLCNQIRDNAFTILVIDDGSNDDTLRIAKSINGVNVITHPYNKGYGATLKTGIIAAKTEYIAFYDSDGQHNPDDLLNLWENVSKYDMLVGERVKGSHKDWIRKPGKWVLCKVANFLTGRKIPDLNSGLRIIKRDVILNMLYLFPDGFSFSTTSTIAMMNMGYNIGYYPIKTNKRVGKSSVKQIKHGSSTILLIMRLIVLFNPLKVFLPISGFLFLTGIVYEIIWGILIIQSIKIIPGALLLILSGILVFFFGLMTDQISAIRKYLSVMYFKK
jgi:glycosyltransferase involved in cell wall biosynthesis